MNTADLTIILGSPASGKTTLAQRLEHGFEPSVSRQGRCQGSAVRCAGGGRPRLVEAVERGELRGAGAPGARAARARPAPASSKGIGAPRTRRSLQAYSPITAPVRRKSAAAPSRGKSCGASHRAPGIAGHLDGLLALGELDAAAQAPPLFLDLSGPRWVYCSDSRFGLRRAPAALEKLARCDLSPRARRHQMRDPQCVNRRNVMRSGYPYSSAV